MKKREVIAFIGRQGSGKSFQSKKLVKERGFKKLSFADPLRDIAFQVIGMDFENGMKQYDILKRTTLINGLNFRNILENLGAAVRKYDKDFWAMALVTNIERCAENIVIDDMRYPNEYEIVRNFCNKHDYSFKAYFCDYKSDIYVENNEHESARMSNYLANNGYENLQLVQREDIFNYSVIIDEQLDNVKNNPFKQNDLMEDKNSADNLADLLKRLGNNEKD